MAEQLVSLQEMAARFEHLKDDELEIACELTIPVTISVYRGHTEDGSAQPLFCGIQFEGKEDVSSTTTLLDPSGEVAHTLEDVSEAFNIPLDAKIWKITAEDESE
jgi:hypothetical protein